MKKIVYTIILLFLCCNIYSQLPREDFTIVVNGIEIPLGAETKNMLEVFGEVEYTLFDNSYRIFREYSYPWGKMYSSDNDDGHVFGIKSESEAVKTKKGIFIGSSKEDVISLYGEPYHVIENLNHYYYINNDFDVLELKFVFNEKDEVCFLSIFMGT